MDLINSEIMNLCCSNMHGFNTGLLMVQDLTLSNDIIALQEHRLSDKNIHRLGMCSEKFTLSSSFQ